MAQRVLVVDDDPDVLDLVTDILRSHPLAPEVVKVADGPSALRAIERQAFDLVLLDIWMPDMDGLEALTRIRALAPGLPVLMVTGSDSESASRALQKGAFGYLPKPLDLRYVAHIVSLALSASPAPAHA
jgi:two-component system nitrogen regulation response regulator NtrX